MGNKNLKLKNVLCLSISGLMAVSSLNLAVFAGVDQDDQVKENNGEEINLGIDGAVEKNNGEEPNLDIEELKEEYINEIENKSDEANKANDIKRDNFHQMNRQIEERGSLTRNIRQKQRMFKKDNYIIIDENTFPDNIFRREVIKILNQNRFNNYEARFYKLAEEARKAKEIEAKKAKKIEAENIGFKKEEEKFIIDIEENNGEEINLGEVAEENNGEEPNLDIEELKEEYINEVKNKSNEADKANATERNNLYQMKMKMEKLGDLKRNIGQKKMILDVIKTKIDDKVARKMYNMGYGGTFVRPIECGSKVRLSEIEEIKEININNSDIRNLEGIEYLTSLEELTCSNNSNLEKIDVSGCERLKKLFGGENQNLREIKGLKNLINLEEVRFNRNNLERIDVSGCKKLSFIYVGGNENLEEIIIKNCPLLERKNIFCDERYRIIENKDGYIINIDRIKINEENFKDHNFRNYVIEILNNGNNGLNIHENDLIDKDLLNKIKMIDIANKDIKDLKGIEHFKNLQILFCSNNNLEKIDVSGCISLQTIECSNNNLERIDVSGCIKLNFISAIGNKSLKEIIARNCSRLNDRNILRDPGCNITRD